MVQYVLNPFTGRFDALSGTGSGGGTITQVGDVTSGAAFSGTQGTTLTSTTAGFNLAVNPQGASNNSDGGDITITAGTSGTLSTGGAAGDVVIQGAAGFGGFEGGDASLIAGTAGATGVGGIASLIGGKGSASGSSSAGIVQVVSGSANTAVADRQSGQVIIKDGIHTGNARPGVITIFGSTYTATSGLTQSTSVDRFITNATIVDLVSTVPETIVSWTLSSAFPSASGTIFYSVEARDEDAAQYQIEVGQVQFVSVLNIDTIEAIGTVTPAVTELSITTTGAISTNWSFDGAGLNGGAVCAVTTTGLDAIDYLVMYYSVVTNSSNHVAVNP